MSKKTKKIVAIIFDVIIVFLLILGKIIGVKWIVWLFDNYWITSFISDTLSISVIHIFNYYIMATLVYKLYIFIQLNTGHYNYYIDKYNKIVSNCINWLISCKVNWGVKNTSEITQNANTCEVLLALYLSGQRNNKSEIYRKAFETVIGNLTEKGLPSKSLQKPTVVCTSMFLDIVAKETSDPILKLIKRSDYEGMANILWRCRNETSGWGVYVSKTDRNCCSLVNTCWALRALSNYKISNSKEFKSYLRRIFQYANNGGFGFNTGDNTRLIATAMYFNLYTKLNHTLKNSIKEIYNPQAAINFIFKSFVVKNIEIEVETLYGINPTNSPGARQAPWKHIVVGQVLEALFYASRNNMLDLLKKNLFFSKINKILKQNVKKNNNNQCYYIPENIELNNDGIFTFPTSYLIQGLSHINDL